MNFKTKLTSGATLVTKKIPGVNSVSIGFWVKGGSRTDPEGKWGLTHFIEHLLFKGTKNRSQKEISKAIDSVGGILDAFTTREYSCFSSRVLKKDLPLAIEIITDILQNPLFSEDDTEMEKSVIIQEIQMVLDNCEDYIFDLLYEKMWKDNPLGRPIQGYVKTVRKLTAKEIRSHFKKYYHPSNIVISAAGNLDKGEIYELLNRNLKTKAFFKTGTKTAESLPSKHLNGRIRKDAEQSHVVFGYTAPPATSKDAFPAIILNCILGGSLSSRLFQEIREKQGLVYSIFSDITFYSDTGILSIYAQSGGKEFSKVKKLINREVNKAIESISYEEVKLAKSHILGNYNIALESVESRMSKLAKDEIFFGRAIPEKKVFEKINKVTLKEVKKIAESVLNGSNRSIITITGKNGV